MARKTVIFPIYPTKEQEAAFLKTIYLYTMAWIYCINVAWSMKNLTKVELHKATYAAVKENFDLLSQYICSSRDKAFEAVKSARILMRHGKKVSKPTAEMIPVRLDARTLSFDKERTTASIAAQGGRIKIPLIWHEHAKRYESWDCKAGEIALNNKGRWVLRLVFEKDFEMPPRTGRVFGADRGIKHPIVLSNNKFYGERWWQEHERTILVLIAKLQSKGTKSAKRRLKKTWCRLRRFRIDCDRVIIKHIFKSCEQGDTVVFENLTDIREGCGRKGKARKKHRSKIGRWSFRRQESIFSDNAEVFGVYVETVDARYTSQTCSRCNTVLKKNRKSQSLYSCSCGLKLNADLNAARNIAKKWCMANGYTSGPTVNRPIVAVSSQRS